MTPLWDPLTDGQRLLLASQTEVFELSRGEVIYHIGDDPLYLMYLLCGRVTLYRHGLPGQRQQVVRMVEPGGIFGYRAAFASEQQSTTAIASEPLRVAAVPMSLVFHLTWENSAFAMLFIRELSQLLGTSLKRTISMTQKHIRGRLAEILLVVKDKYGFLEDGQTLAIYVSREDLASIANMTTSNAIRTLSAFAQEGLVAIEGRRLRYLDIPALERISQLG